MDRVETREQPEPTATRPSLAQAARRLRPVVLLAALVILADQATKAWIRGWLAPGERWPEGWDLIQLSHVHNSGAAFGIFQGAGTFLIVTTLIGIAAIVAYAIFAPVTDRWYGLGLGLVLGGAIGNLVDRLRLGYVTDFIDPTHYPAFNIADSAIVVGVIGLAALAFLAPEGQR